MTAPFAGVRRMRPRDPAEAHRAASPLELLFDLVFVVAVSFSSQELHHVIAGGALGEGVLSYLMVFFAIWWAWMNFTWFANSFDVDDWLYRILTIVQMGGVLVLAAGTSEAIGERDFTIVTIGYVIMRLALVSQWVRAAVADPTHRATAIRYAVGVVVVQLAWVGRLLLPEAAGLAAFLVLLVAEVSVPIWAERHGRTPLNPHHIAERYSLFTLILLGESILASAGAVVEAIDVGEHLAPLLAIASAGLVIVAGMWWVYFSREHHEHIRGFRSTLFFGYFHYVIFAAAGAFSAGIEVAIDGVAGEAELSPIAVNATLTVPVGLFLLGIWWLTLRHRMGRAANAVFLVGICVILLGTFAAGLAGLLIAAVGVVVAVVATELPVRA